MIHDFTKVKNIYIIRGRTDMRKGIDGLATLVQDSFKLDPYSEAVFLFSGWKRDRYKCLFSDGDVSRYSISDSIMVDYNGQRMKNKCVS